jgi:hypothetical protein
MLSIGEVAQHIETILGPAADRLAQDTGWVRRRSKLTGALFVRTLVLGWLKDPQASLGGLCRTAASLGVTISPQGLDQRFTPSAAAALKAVLDQAVQAVLATEPVAIPLLLRFGSVTVEDSSTVVLPAELAEQWAGCGNATAQGAAALKLQVRLDVCTGRLCGPQLVDGRAADQRSAIPLAVPVGGLRMADLGYFDLDTFAAVSAQQGYWLSRLQSQTAVFDAAGQRLELVAWLRARSHQVVDEPVALGRCQHLPARLLAVPVPQAVADARRRKLRETARHQGRTVSQERLVLAGWTVLVTNAPAELLAVEDGLVLYRVRWQIELLFKLWKQYGQIDEWRSGKPWRILCELYAKLVAMVHQHWCLLLGCWQVPNRSWVKAAEAIREQIGQILATGCRLNRRRAHPNTVQLLFDPALLDSWLKAA